MTRGVATANRRIQAGEEWAAIGLFYLLLGVIVVQVIARFVLRIPLPWTEEFGRFTFVWLNALGASIGVRWGAHFVAVHLADALKGSPRVVLCGAVDLIIAVVAAVLVWQGIHLAEIGREQVTPILGLPMVWVYAAVPVGAALMLWHLLVVHALGVPRAQAVNMFESDAAGR